MKATAYLQQLANASNQVDDIHTPEMSIEVATSGRIIATPAATEVESIRQAFAGLLESHPASAHHCNCLRFPQAAPFPTPSPFIIWYRGGILEVEYVAESGHLVAVRVPVDYFNGGGVAGMHTLPFKSGDVAFFILDPSIAPAWQNYCITGIS